MGLFNWLDRLTGGPISTGPSYDPDRNGAPRLTLKPVSGSFFRLHSSTHLHRHEFWRTFLDGDWKWTNQERFAGTDLNCGHYFAQTSQGARAEAEYYGRHRNRVLLEVRAKFDSVLDLTDLGCMRYAMGLYAEDKNDVLHSHLYRLLSFLTDATEGGNAFTDLIGRWAANQGFDGVRFFSARALTPHQRRLVATPDHLFELDEACGFTQQWHCAELREDATIQNLVAFSGARLTASITAFRLEGESWRPNPFAGISDATYDEILRERGVEFDSDYQARMWSRVAMREGPSVPVEPWNPSKGDKKRRRGAGGL